MTIPTLRVVGWSALLVMGVVIALVGMPPSGAPNDPVDADDVLNDADPRIDVRHHEHPQEQQTEAAITVIAAPPKAIPQNVEDLRAGNPLLAPIIEANEQALAAKAGRPPEKTNE